MTMLSAEYCHQEKEKGVGLRRLLNNLQPFSNQSYLTLSLPDLNLSLSHSHHLHLDLQSPGRILLKVRRKRKRSISFVEDQISWKMCPKKEIIPSHFMTIRKEVVLGLFTGIACYKRL